MPLPTPENPPFNPNHNAFIPSIDPYIPFAPGGSLYPDKSGILPDHTGIFSRTSDTAAVPPLAVPNLAASEATPPEPDKDANTPDLPPAETQPALPVQPEETEPEAPVPAGSGGGAGGKPPAPPVQPPGTGAMPDEPEKDRNQDRAYTVERASEVFGVGHFRPARSPEEAIRAQRLFEEGIKEINKKYQEIATTDHDTGSRYAHLHLQKPAGMISLHPSTSLTLDIGFYNADVVIGDYCKYAGVEGQPGLSKESRVIDPRLEQTPDFGEVPDRLRTELEYGCLGPPVFTIASPEEVNHFLRSAREAEPIPITFLHIYRVAMNRYHSLLKPDSLEDSAIAAKDFERNIQHFLRRHSYDSDKDIAVRPKYHDIRGEAFLKVEAGEQRDFYNVKSPVLQVEFESPVDKYDQPIPELQGPARRRVHLQWSLRKKHVTVAEADGQTKLGLGLVSTLSGYYTKGRRRVEEIPRQAMLAEGSEAWMATHFLQNPIITNQDIIPRPRR
jgi:hypothetical protein